MHSSSLDAGSGPGAATSAESAVIARAYDAASETYEAQTDAARWVRERLWKRFDALFLPGARILDVAAGTGLDAEHLADRGVFVVACDLSPLMLAHLRSRTPSIETHLADFNRLDRLPVEGPFDGIISSFAGLNTSRDLSAFALDAARLLRPGGMLVLHLLGRWPVLDCARLLFRGEWRRGFRVLLSWRRDVRVGGILVPHYAQTPAALYRRTFAPHFAMVRWSGQGVIRPVDARWGRRLETLEERLSHRSPFRSAGTFFAMELRRR
jgi:SAM-dependent methyltransferase